MNWIQGDWEKVDRGDNWEIICPHPSGTGRQSLGYFRKQDLTPLVNLIVGIPNMYKVLKELYASLTNPGDLNLIQQVLTKVEVVATTGEGK